MTRIMTPVETIIHEACAHSIITQDDWDALVTAFTQARNEALDEAIAHLRGVADVVDSQGNITAHTIARLYRGEADAILALKSK